MTSTLPQPAVRRSPRKRRIQEDDESEALRLQERLIAVEQVGHSLIL